MTDLRDDIRVAIGIADSLQIGGNVLAPAANGLICSLAAPPAGIYEIRVRLAQGPAATIAAADIGNWNILKGVAGIAFGGLPTGCEIIFPRITLDGASAVKVQAIGAATAGVEYAASISATRVE